MSEPIHYLTIEALSTEIEARRLSPVEVTEHMLARIKRLDGKLKSYATVMADSAIAEARQAEAEIAAGHYRGKHHGVPIAVKDLCFTKGVRTMGGLKVLADHVPDFDATVVEKFRAAGAVMLGKLNLTEGAMAGYNPDFDVPDNPWRSGYWAGASSSGSGAATAAGLAFATLGSDTGGSIRHGRAEANLWAGEPPWRARPRPDAGPCRATDPLCRRCGHCHPGDSRPRPARSNLPALPRRRPAGWRGQEPKRRASWLG